METGDRARNGENAPLLFENIGTPRLSRNQSQTINCCGGSVSSCQGRIAIVQVRQIIHCIARFLQHQGESNTK